MQKTAVDFVIASLIGAILLTLVGYFAVARELSISFWVGNFFQYGAWHWAALGILIGSGLRYLAR